MSITRYQPGTGRFCQAVRCGDLLFISGQYGDSSKDMKGQAQELFAKCDVILESYGLDKTNVVFANIGLHNIQENIAAFNEAWDEWIVPGHEPARTCLGVEIAFPGYFAEVSFVAAI